MSISSKQTALYTTDFRRNYFVAVVGDARKFCGDCVCGCGRAQGSRTRTSSKWWRWTAAAARGAAAVVVVAAAAHDAAAAAGLQDARLDCGCAYDAEMKRARHARDLDCRCDRHAAAASSACGWRRRDGARPVGTMPAACVRTARVGGTDRKRSGGEMPPQR